MDQGLAHYRVPAAFVADDATVVRRHKALIGNRNYRRCVGAALRYLKRGTKVPEGVRAVIGPTFFERLQIQVALAAAGWAFN